MKRAFVLPHGGNVGAVIAMESAVQSPHVFHCFVLQDELREEVKNEVKWNVDRDSAEEKVRDFVGWMKACKEDINHQVRLLKVSL